MAESWYMDLPKIREKKEFFGIARGVEGVAQWNFQRLGMKYDKNIKNDFFPKNFLFSMKKNRLNFLESHILLKILYDL